jgi:hypothetical protein
MGKSWYSASVAKSLNVGWHIAIVCYMASLEAPVACSITITLGSLMVWLVTNPTIVTQSVKRLNLFHEQACPLIIILSFISYCSCRV